MGRARACFAFFKFGAFQFQFWVTGHVCGGVRAKLGFRADEVYLDAAGQLLKKAPIWSFCLFWKSSSMNFLIWNNLRFEIKELRIWKNSRKVSWKRRLKIEFIKQKRRFKITIDKVLRFWINLAALHNIFVSLKHFLEASTSGEHFWFAPVKLG